MQGVGHEGEETGEVVHVDDGLAEGGHMNRI